MKKVSVIIPFYSGKEYLLEALESVFNQTYDSYEVILINDGSKENIDDIVKKYKNKIIYIHHDNKGASYSRNRGIERATGKYIAFLDSDDIWEKTKLEKQVRLMEKEDYVWSHTAYVDFDNSTKVTKNIPVSHLHGDISNIVIFSAKIATPAVMIKRSELVKNKLLFNEKMKKGQDTAFWIVLAKKYEIGLLDLPLLRVRKDLNSSSISITSQLQTRHLLYPIIKKHYKNIKPFIGKLGYIFCYKFGKFSLAKAKKWSPKLLNFVSGIVYLLPYISFKLSARIVRGKK